ncbi:MAG: hypothetical protein ABIK08_11325 [Pseudomonadota bacterium]
MALSPLPPTSDFVTTGETKATFKGALSGLRAFLNSLLGSTGSQADALTALGAPLNGSVAKTATYKVVAANRGQVIDCSGGSWTLDVDAVATLGAGFTFGVKNSDTGVITVDPNLSESIDGAASLDIGPGESCLIQVDESATELRSFGRTVSLPAATASINGYMTSTYAAKLDGIAAGATVGVPVDVGVGGIGYIGVMTLLSSSCASGATVSGSSLHYSNPASGTFSVTSSSVGAGTWRNISPNLAAGGEYQLFQRIA